MDSDTSVVTKEDSNKVSSANGTTFDVNSNSSKQNDEHLSNNLKEFSVVQDFNALEKPSEEIVQKKEQLSDDRVLEASDNVTELKETTELVSNMECPLPPKPPQTQDVTVPNIFIIKHEMDTQLPLKKRKVSVVNLEGLETKEDLSYPASPMMNIAQILEGCLGRVRTAAEKKETYMQGKPSFCNVHEDSCWFLEGSNYEENVEK